MRASPLLLAAVLCAASIGTGFAQTPTHPASASKVNPKIPASMSFVYDAQHDQINAAGVQLKPALAANAVAPTTGTIAVTITINVASHFSRGTTYHCSLTALGGEIDTDNATIAGGIETANGLGKWTGPGALTCTLNIPYSWTIPADPSADTGLILAFGVSAVTAATPGATGAVERSTLQLDGIENLPASGATSTFAFGVTL
jgi:hypothetical protein